MDGPQRGLYFCSLALLYAIVQSLLVGWGIFELVQFPRELLTPHSNELCQLSEVHLLLVSAVVTLSLPLLCSFPLCVCSCCDCYCSCSNFDRHRTDDDAEQEARTNRMMVTLVLSVIAFVVLTLSLLSFLYGFVVLILLYSTNLTCVSYFSTSLESLRVYSLVGLIIGSVFVVFALVMSVVSATVIFVIQHLFRQRSLRVGGIGLTRTNRNQTQQPPRQLRRRGGGRGRRQPIQPPGPPEAEMVIEPVYVPPPLDDPELYDALPELFRSRLQTILTERETDTTLLSSPRTHTDTDTDGSSTNSNSTDSDYILPDTSVLRMISFTDSTSTTLSDSSTPTTTTTTTVTDTEEEEEEEEEDGEIRSPPRVREERDQGAGAGVGVGRSLISSLRNLVSIDVTNTGAGRPVPLFFSEMPNG